MAVLRGADMRERAAVERIRSFNSGREPERLRIKFDKMAADPFSFFRGTCHLFYTDWPKHTPLDEAPAAWLCGDLHLENFGSYKGDNRLTYFDINDFDEAGLAPITWDLARMVTSVRLAAALAGLDDEARRAVEQTFLRGYRDALMSGKARWIERAIATGLIGDLLAKVGERKRGAFLEARTRLRSQRRELKPIKGKTLEMSTNAEADAVMDFMRRFAAKQADANFFAPLDIKRRIAGTGSLGLRRYVILVEGHGSPDSNYLIDLKEAAPSALAPRLRLPQPRWKTPAARATDLQQRLQANSPALLHAVRFDGRSWILRELQPSEDRVAFDAARERPHELVNLARTLGYLTAWAHLRSSGREGSATADALIGFAETHGWIGKTRAYAKRYGAMVMQDWKAFKVAHKRGAFVKLLA
jgi:uncharacterized protein (DUF2252 family)